MGSKMWFCFEDIFILFLGLTSFLDGDVTPGAKR